MSQDNMVHWLGVCQARFMGELSLVIAPYAQLPFHTSPPTY